MKRFLIQIFAFTVLVCLFYSVGYALYFIRVRTMSFKLPQDITRVFCGTSHFETGVDVAHIPHAFNFSMSGNPRLYQYVRLKRLLEDNPQIKTVFTTFDSHTMKPQRDGDIFSDDTMSPHLSNSLVLFGYDECLLYLQKAPLKSLKYSMAKPSQLLSRLWLSDDEIIAQFGHQMPYENNESRASHNLREDALNRLKTREIRYPPTNFTVDYTRKMVAHGAEIIFIDTPFHRADEMFSVERMAYFNNVRTNSFADVRYWNYRDYPIPNDCRRDANHLNRWGAEIFSKELARRIEQDHIE